MRTVGRVGIALLLAFALSTPVSAQTFDRISLTASVGPSFATLGTTFSTTAAIDYRVTDRATLAGEFGFLPHAPFSKAEGLAPAAPANAESRAHVNAYHWNGNLRVRVPEYGRFEPYVTAGLGSFAADTVVGRGWIGPSMVGLHSRVSDFATNVGAGVQYRLNDWVGLTADYRTFFVHRENDTPRVNRFTTGLAFSLR